MHYAKYLEFLEVASTCTERRKSLTGFQIFLCVFFGIIALFVLVLSIPVHVYFTYSDKIYLTIRYLFIQLDLLPLGEKKSKKEKKPKKEKPKKEKEEKPEEEPKKKNSILDMVKANGYDGMMNLLSELKRILSGWGGKVFRSVVFDELEIYVTVGTGDSAATAIEYGKVCQKVYPLVAFLCSNNVVRKYDCSVEPDFLANHSEGEVNVAFHMCVRKVINATIAMAVRLVFKVLLKFLKGAKAKPASDNTVPQKAEQQSVK